MSNTLATLGVCCVCVRVNELNKYMFVCECVFMCVCVCVVGCVSVGLFVGVGVWCSWMFVMPPKLTPKEVCVCLGGSLWGCEWVWVFGVRGCLSCPLN
jgi:hypothetical protein